MEIRNEFADWYRLASVVPSTEHLVMRWAGVEAASSILTANHIIDLVRLFVVKPEAGYVAPAFFDKAFRDHDPAFPTRDNSQELRVLAGATLRNVIDEELAAAPAVAYGIVSAAFGSRLPGVPTKDHVTYAQEFLVNRGTAVRNIKTIGPKALAVTPARLEELMPAAHFSPSEMTKLREGLFTALVEILTKTSQNVSSLTALMQNQREELDLLWWLQNGFSKDLQTSFANLGVPTATMVLPVELSDLTTFIPGSAAIFGMIVSALRQVSEKDVKVSIKAAVNAAPRDWRKKTVDGTAGQPGGNLCPVQLAMAKSLETDGDEDWIPAFKKQSAMNAEDEFEARDLAHQFFCERMFVRALSELKK